LCPFLSFLIKSSSAFLLLFSQRKLGSDKSLAHYVAIWKKWGITITICLLFSLILLYVLCVSFNRTVGFTISNSFGRNVVVVAEMALVKQLVCCCEAVLKSVLDNVDVKPFGRT
jgi:hypothetical protein